MKKEKENEIKKEDELNVYQKLNLLRCEILKRGIKKTGVNKRMEFMYFQLEDFLPQALELCKEIGLTVIETEDIRFYNNQILKEWEIKLFDCNKTGDVIKFSQFFSDLDPIINKHGEKVTNNLQLKGSANTYLRRYAWMLLLELTEHEVIDENLGNVENVEIVNIIPSKKNKTPKTAEERQEIKENLINDERLAEGLQKNAILNLVTELLNSNKITEEQHNNITVKYLTNENLTYSQANDLIKKMKEDLLK